MLRACVLDLGGRWDSHLPTIAIILALGWLLLSLYMDDDVDHQFVGMELEKGS